MNGDPFARQAELLSRIREGAKAAPRRRPSWAEPCDDELLDQLDADPLTALSNILCALKAKRDRRPGRR